jgi:hypothetical protein
MSSPGGRESDGDHAEPAPGERRPFVLTSGYSKALAGDVLGPDVVLVPKPYDMNELAALIHGLLDRSRR